MSVQENPLSDPTRIGPDHYRAMLAQRGRGWVAEIDGRIAGFAVVDRTCSTIWALFVHPAFEGRGIGRRLHDVMMEWVFEAGAEVVRLSTSPGTRAETFYTAAGWQRAGREANGASRFEMTRDAWRARSSGA